MQEKIKERTNFSPILIGTFLSNLCQGYARFEILKRIKLLHFWFITNLKTLEFKFLSNKDVLRRISDNFVTYYAHS